MEPQIEGYKEGEFHHLNGISQERNADFADRQDVKEFIKWNFAPGPLKMQEADGPTVNPEMQEHILQAIPQFIVEMMKHETPLNPKEGKEDEHITAVLRPDFIGTKEGQILLKKTQTEWTRTLRGMGIRVWTKMVQKALTEDSPQDKIHPFSALHGYNGLTVGLPNRSKPESYQDFLVTQRIEPEDVIMLMVYEANNNLLTKEDKTEIYALIVENKTFAKKIQESLKTNIYSTTKLMAHLPLTMELIERLGIDQHCITNIIAFKKALGSIDKETIETIRNLNTPENQIIQLFIQSDPKLLRTFSKTPQVEDAEHIEIEPQPLTEENAKRIRTRVSQTLKDDLGAYMANYRRNLLATYPELADSFDEEDNTSNTNFNLSSWSPPEGEPN